MTTETTTEEVLLHAPHALFEPSGDVSAEEVTAALATLCRAAGAPEPTPAQIDAERAARAAEQQPPAGEQGRQQARRRFGTRGATEASSAAPGAGGRAMAAKRFGGTAADRHAADLALARTRAGR